MFKIDTKSPEETYALGKEIGELLKPGDVVAITGELGAGKTTLIKGLAKGLGVSGFVSSPSFIIINEYSGKFPFYHIDLYRLEEVQEIEELGISEYFERGGIVAIEWAEKLASLLPERFITISIELLGEKERRITLKEKGINRLKPKFGEGKG